MRSKIDESSIPLFQLDQMQEVLDLKSKLFNPNFLKKNYSYEGNVTFFYLNT